MGAQPIYFQKFRSQPLGIQPNEILAIWPQPLEPYLSIESLSLSCSHLSKDNQWTPEGVQVVIWGSSEVTHITSNFLRLIEYIISP